MKLSEVFVLIVPQVVRILFGEWEAVLAVCCPRARRGVKKLRWYDVAIVLVVPSILPSELVNMDSLDYYYISDRQLFTSYV